MSEPVSAYAQATSSLDVKEPKGTRELRNALQRLSRNSRNVDALIDAGNAALLLDDPRAAVGFFGRAEEIAPRNGRVKAGLGSALLRTENPYEALRLFEEAVALGVVASVIAGDRGLAYDLVGQNDLAQRDYTLAIRRGGDDEIVRRYALSLGITGDVQAAEEQLDPLLRKRDSAAWRIRAFVLAINGDLEGAEAISSATLRPQTAAALSPFFAYMPKLTKAQQAAAAHFGHFPQSANIGKDDPRVRAFAQRERGVTDRRRADAGLIPAGKPLGQQADVQSPPPDIATAAATTTAPISREPRRRPGQVSASTDRAGQDVVQAAEVDTSVQAVSQAAAETNVTLADADSNQAEERPIPGFKSLGNPVQQDRETSSFDLARNAATHSQPTATAGLSSAATPGSTQTGVIAKDNPVPVSVPEPAKRSFADIMGSIDIPASEMGVDDGAVDLDSITPAKAAPKPPPKPKKPPPPKHPSRYWVQVAGGADRATLAREWKRLVAKAPQAFAGKDGWTTPLNRTNRILAGPFDSARAAQRFVNRLAESDIAAFAWKSEQGQEIKKLK